MAPRLLICGTTVVVGTTTVRATITEKEMIRPPNASFKACTRNKRSDSSLLCPGGEWNHVGQVVWLSWVQDCNLGRNAVFGHSVTPEPAKFHLKHKPLINRTCSSVTHCTEEHSLTCSPPSVPPVPRAPKCVVDPCWGYCGSQMMQEDGHHYAVVNPHVDKILLIAQVYWCVDGHMGHPALPHCTSSKEV